MKTAVAFLTGLALVLAGTFVVLNKVSYGRYTYSIPWDRSIVIDHPPVTMYRRLKRQFVFGDTFGAVRTRLHEAASRGPVDVVTVGSSLSYRGLDPRVFASAGYSYQTLATPAQQPILSKALVEGYWDVLRPEVVVLDVSAPSLLLPPEASNSFECLVLDLPWSTWRKLGLAFVQPRVERLLFTLARAVEGEVLYDRGDAATRSRSFSCNYVAGGFCAWDVRATEQERAGASKRRAQFRSLARSSRADPGAQLDAIAGLADLVRTHHARFAIYIQPLPADSPFAFPDRSRRELEELARERGIPLFAPSMEEAGLSPAHYTDDVHLTSEGARIVSRLVVDWLRRRTIADAGSPPAPPESAPPPSTR